MLWPTEGTSMDHDQVGAARRVPAIHPQAAPIIVIVSFVSLRTNGTRRSGPPPQDGTGTTGLRKNRWIRTLTWSMSVLTSHSFHIPVLQLHQRMMLPRFLMTCPGRPTKNDRLTDMRTSNSTKAPVTCTAGSRACRSSAGGEQESYTYNWCINSSNLIHGETPLEVSTLVSLADVVKHGREFCIDDCGTKISRTNLRPMKRKDDIVCVIKVL